MKVTKVERTGLKEHCFDIEVEEVHEYLMANGAVVHNSSKAAGVPNCWYPVRELAMGKSDANNVIDWVAMDSDILKDNYQPAWSVKPIAMINAYAVIQRIGCDQGISADVYADRSENIDLSATDLILLTAETSRKGLKSRYYFNSKTNSAETKAAAGCGSGGCTL